MVRSAPATAAAGPDQLGRGGGRARRDTKQVIDLRPVYHRKEHWIRGHVILCWLALLLARMAENACHATWPALRMVDQQVAVWIGGELPSETARLE